jgi:hypothetical protein
VLPRLYQPFASTAGPERHTGRSDHHGWAKAGWALLILVVPLIYLIATPADPFAVA